MVLPASTGSLHGQHPASKPPGWSCMSRGRAALTGQVCNSSHVVTNNARGREEARWTEISPKMTLRSLGWPKSTTVGTSLHLSQGSLLQPWAYGPHAGGGHNPSQLESEGLGGLASEEGSSSRPQPAPSPKPWAWVPSSVSLELHWVTLSPVTALMTCSADPAWSHQTHL